MARRIYASLLLASLILPCSPVFPQSKERDLAIRQSGFVAYHKQSSEEWTPIVASAIVRGGDFVKTDARSSAGLRLHDGSTVRIGPDSIVGIAPYKDKSKSGTSFRLHDGTLVKIAPETVTKLSPYQFEIKSNWIHLVTGKILVHVKPARTKQEIIQITTPSALVTARGTVFSIHVVNGDGATVVEPYSGSVAVDAQGQRLLATPGKVVIVNPQAPPVAVPQGTPIIVKDVLTPAGGDKGSSHPPASSGPGSQTIYESPWQPSDYAPAVSQDAPYHNPGSTTIVTGPSATPPLGAGSSFVPATLTLSPFSQTPPLSQTSTSQPVLPPPVTPPLTPTGGFQVIVR